MTDDQVETRTRLEGLVGKEAGPSRWLEVDQQMIERFAAVTGDEQWIHVDPGRAAEESPFGGTVAHGMLTLSLAPGLAIELLDLGSAPLVVNYGFNRVRFPAPLHSGSRVRMFVTVAQLEPLEEAMRAILDLRFEDEEQAKPVCVAQLVLQIH